MAITAFFSCALFCKDKRKSRNLVSIVLAESELQSNELSKMPTLCFQLSVTFWLCSL